MKNEEGRVALCVGGDGAQKMKVLFINDTLLLLKLKTVSSFHFSMQPSLGKSNDAKTDDYSAPWHH